MTTDEAAAGADPDDDRHERYPQRPPTDGEALNELARMAMANGVLEDPAQFRRLWLLVYGSQVIVIVRRLPVAVGAVCAPGVGYLVASGKGLTGSQIVLLGALILVSGLMVRALVLRRRRRRSRHPQLSQASGDRGDANSGGTSKPRRVQPPTRRKRPRRGR